MSAPVADFIFKLQGKGLKVRRSTKGWTAQCPAHDDRTPSLSIGVGDDGRVLLKCFAGCSTLDVLSAVGIEPRDLFPQLNGATARKPDKIAHQTPTNATKAESPAPEVQPRSLGEQLDIICTILRHYVVFQFAEQVKVCALWIAHTWVIDAFDFTAYLHVFSAEKRSGKSRLLDVLELLVKAPWRDAGASEAVLFRKIERDKPTLLSDEIDTVFHSKASDGLENIRRMFNLGFTRGNKVSRC